MDQNKVAQVKRDVLQMGERTRAFVMSEMMNDGSIRWTYGGSVSDAVFLNWMIDRRLSEDMGRYEHSQRDK